jgi:hypothetical protein
VDEFGQGFDCVGQFVQWRGRQFRFYRRQFLALNGFLGAFHDDAAQPFTDGQAGAPRRHLCRHPAFGLDATNAPSRLLRHCNFACLSTTPHYYLGNLTAKPVPCNARTSKGFGLELNDLAIVGPV